MAGIALDFSTADIWFASVQKCFGLPAGLALMLCSPQTMEHTVRVGENNHYNSITLMADMMRKQQTTHTPNVLGIYLLRRVLQKMPPIKEVDGQIRRRPSAWFDFFDQHNSLRPYIGDRRVRSQTVVTLNGAPPFIKDLKLKAKKKGFVLGAGYGPLNLSTVRIANFPAHKSKEINQLMRFFDQFHNQP